jgi:hypothetical protein
MFAIRKIKPGFVVSGILLVLVILFYVFITSENISPADDSSENCEDCSKNKAKIYLGNTISGSKTETSSDDSNYFSKIFSLLKSGSGQENAGDIIERDPEKDKAVNEINSLSKSVCNEEKLPEDIWISPKLIEKDPLEHKNELEKLITYCRGLKTGETDSQEKREYYKIKIRLLEERKELIRYYIDTLDGQIEDMNEKKIAEMEERKAEDKITPEEEKINTEIETETNRFYEESVANTNKLIEQIDTAIRNYRTELNKL